MKKLDIPQSGTPENKPDIQEKDINIKEHSFDSFSYVSEHLLRIQPRGTTKVLRGSFKIYLYI